VLVHAAFKLIYSLVAKAELGSKSLGKSVGPRGVGNVFHPVLNRPLASDDSLDIVSEHGNHSKATILDLLNFELSGLDISKSSK